MIDTFIRRPVFTTMFILVLVVFGIQSYPSLGVDLYPDVERPIVTIKVTYEGTSPEEMETLVTKPIESCVSQVSGIKTISSTIREGYSNTRLEFEIGTDPRQMASEVREKVAGIRRRLPDDIDEPAVQRFDIASLPIATYAFSSESRSPGEIRRLLRAIVIDELQMVDGVADIAIYGSSNRAIKVEVNPNKLRQYGISMQTVLSKVNGANRNTPGGRIRSDNNTIMVRTIGKFTSVDDFNNILVATVNGRPIRLVDVAEVSDSWADVESFARTNGAPSIAIGIRKQSRTNTVDVIDRVNARIDQLTKADLPPDVKVHHVSDQSQYVRENISDVWSTIFFGGFLALAITYMFLRDIRATIIGGLAIPTSIVATFYLMKQMDFTLNNMSLMGLSLAVGFLIDDAIVLVENIFRHMEMGKNPFHAASDATKELMLAILATSMSLLAVFVPIGSMGETVGQYFKQFGLTVAFALAFSTLSAYTLTPMVSAYWLKPLSAVHANRPLFVTRVLDMFNEWFESLRALYGDIMAAAVHHPKKIIIGALLTLLINLAFLPFLGTELQPVYDSGEFTVMLKAPAGTSLEQMVRWAKPLEEIIQALPELDVETMNVGGVRTGVNEGSIRVRLKSEKERDRGMLDVMAELRKSFSDVGTMRVSVVTGQADYKDPRPVQIGLRGSDIKKLNDYAEDLAEKLRQTPGATDISVIGSDPEPEILIRLNQTKASQLGLDNSSVGQAVQYAFRGKKTKNSYTIGNNDYDIIMQLEKQDRRTMQDVMNLQVSTATGAYIRLGDIADISLESGPQRIDREGRQRQVAVYANAVGISPGELLRTTEEKLIPELNMDVGYRYRLIGDADMMRRVFREIVKAIVFAVVLIYMVLAAEFESYSQPLVIMMSLPFAVIGAVLGLLVANQTANMMSLIGFTMLLGLVTKNAILLIDYANQARRRGMTIRDAVLAACSLRLRPIIMTTLSTMLGMTPIALGLGAGAELRQSMGVVLIGGLTTSTLLTLIIVPLIYILTEEWKERRKARQPQEV